MRVESVVVVMVITMREAQSRNFSLCGLRVGKVKRNTATRTAASATGTCGSELALVQLGVGGTACWGWGVRRLVDAILARVERAFAPKRRSSSASSGAWDRRSGLDFWCLMALLQVYYSYIGIGLFLNLVFSTDTVASSLRFSAILSSPFPPFIRP